MVGVLTGRVRRGCTSALETLSGSRAPAENNELGHSKASAAATGALNVHSLRRPVRVIASSRCCVPCSKQSQLPLQLPLQTVATVYDSAYNLTCLCRQNSCGRCYAQNGVIELGYFHILHMSVRSKQSAVDLS